jgi:ABC-type transport system involved in multi-copper enzyme maturation permease subunit
MLVLVLLSILGGTYQAHLSYLGQIELYGRGEGPEPTPLSAFTAGIWMAANAALPLLSIASAFGAIVGERAAGTMQLLLSRPTSKGAIVRGKFLGAFAVVTLASLMAVLLTTGLTTALVGPLQMPDLVRIMAFSLLLILYSSIWVSISMFISAVARGRASSLAVSVFLLVLFAGWPITSIALTNLFAPLPSIWSEDSAWRAAISDLAARGGGYLNWLSPSSVFTASAGALLNPWIDVAPFATQSNVPTLPMDIIGTLQEIWPCISAMIAMLILALIASYVVVRMEGIEVEGKP